MKIRGYRVEPGEIETVLASHPAVREAAVVVTEAGTGDKRLVAYVVAAEGVTCSPRELRELVAARLPDYMVPAFFALVKTLPLTPSGKLDRRTLSHVDIRGTGSASAGRDERRESPTCATTQTHLVEQRAAAPERMMWSGRCRRSGRMCSA